MIFFVIFYFVTEHGFNNPETTSELYFAQVTYQTLLFQIAENTPNSRLKALLNCALSEIN